MNFRTAVFILILFSILSGIHLFLFAQNVGLKYSLTDLKLKLAEITSQNRLLGSRVAREENLDYIEKVARGKLGMVYPEKIIYIAGSRESVPARK